MKITAVVLDSIGGPVSVDTLDLDEPRTGEVLVKLAASGVCPRCAPGVAQTSRPRPGLAWQCLPSQYAWVPWPR